MNVRCSVREKERERERDKKIEHAPADVGAKPAAWLTTGRLSISAAEATAVAIARVTKSRAVDGAALKTPYNTEPTRPPHEVMNDTYLKSSSTIVEKQKIFTLTIYH